MCYDSVRVAFEDGRQDDVSTRRLRQALAHATANGNHEFALTLEDELNFRDPQAAAADYDRRTEQAQPGWKSWAVQK